MEIKTTSDVISVVDAGADLMSAEQSELTKLQPENARLIALLKAHGIQWQLPPEPEAEPEPPPLTTDKKIKLFHQLFRWPYRYLSSARGE